MMWPFSSQEEVPQLSYEFDGQYLSWTQKTGTFLCVDLSAVNSIFIGASNELGAFESGVAGQLLGTSMAVVTGGLATLLVVVVWWIWFPALSRIDRFEELEDQADP